MVVVLVKWSAWVLSTFTNRIRILLITTNDVFIYCIKCDQSIPLNESIRKEIDSFINELDSSSSFNCYCKQIPENEILKVKGIFVTNEFVSSAEERYLFEEINKTPWVDSQSGKFLFLTNKKINFK